MGRTLPGPLSGSDPQSPTDSPIMSRGSSLHRGFKLPSRERDSRSGVQVALSAAVIGGTRTRDSEPWLKTKNKHAAMSTILLLPLASWHMSQLPCSYSSSRRTFNGQHTLKLSRNEMLQFCTKREDKAGIEPMSRRENSAGATRHHRKSLLQVARVQFPTKAFPRAMDQVQCEPRACQLMV